MYLEQRMQRFVRFAAAATALLFFAGIFIGFIYTAIHFIAKFW